MRDIMEIFDECMCAAIEAEKSSAASAGYDLASPETLEDRVHFLECLVLEQQKAIELLAGNAASELRAKIWKIKASARLLALLQNHNH